MGLKIFVVVPEFPKPDRSAGYRRLVALLEILARHHRVDLWVENDFREEEIAAYRPLFETARVRLLSAGWKSLATALARTRYDVGFFEFYSSAERNAYEFRRRQPGTKVIIDSVDVHFAREVAGAELGVIDSAQVEKTRESELAAYRAADAVIVVTEEDARILRAEGDMPSLFVLPIVMPTRPRVLSTREPELLFVGGFNHLPNVDGLRWFVKDVWPRVYRVVPDARFTIIGNNPPPEVQAFVEIPGIEVLGYVPDTNPYLDRAMISVAPLRYGAGMKGKVVEAMSSGLPVVTTSIGAQGLNARSGEHLLVADHEDDFAQSLIDLVNDAERCEQMGLAGQSHIASLCGPQSVEKSVVEMLQTVVPARRSVRAWLHWRGFHTLVALQLLRRYLAHRKTPGRAVIMEDNGR